MIPSTDSSNSSTASVVTQPPPTQVDNDSQTTPTVTSNRTKYNSEVKAYLGSNVSAFQALFGSQGDTKIKGAIIWTLSQKEWFSLTFDSSNNHVYDLDYYFYPASQTDNHQQDNVSFEVARNICSRFIPPDSKLISTNANKPDPSLADGLQYIYKSKWLSQQLDASLFYFDEGAGTMNNKLNTPVDPGTFTLFYIGNEQMGYEMCFLTTGINWPS